MGNPYGHVTHGKRHTGAYKSWAYMKTRVLNKNNKDYHYYKDKGMDERWLTFEEFYKDMGDRPEGLTIERIDNSKGYFPWNCKWATRKEQANNKKWGGSTKLTKEDVIKIRTELMSLSTYAIAKMFGVSASTICAVKNNQSWREVSNV